MKRPHHSTLTLLVVLGFFAAQHLTALDPARAFSLGLRATDSDEVKSSPTRIGIISYWNLDDKGWETVPKGSLVLINPEDGVLEGGTDNPVNDLAKWQDLFKKLKDRKLNVLGYVQTGYFDHETCKTKPKANCQLVKRIKLQVKTYYDKFTGLDGIFFDETSPQESNEATADYKKEYELLRSMNFPGRITVFNVGWTSEKAVQATKKGEHLVLYESHPDGYVKDADLITKLTSDAHQRGIIVWHLLHSVTEVSDMCTYVKEMNKRGADYGYITNIGGNWEQGENTWGSLPPYWADELSAFENQRCPIPTPTPTPK